MVDFANETFGTDSISFSHMDIAKVQHPRDVFPEGFDKIFSLYCLHWVKDLPLAFKNIHDLLNINGQALVIFLASNPIFRMYRSMARNIKWSAYMLV